MTAPQENENRWLASRPIAGDAYDARYDERAAAGEDVHGEATCVEGFHPRSVLDGGCGTGRVGRELARRGLDVVGVDIDAEMLATAQRKSPDATWHLGDLATLDLDRRFDAIVLAGNVMIFLAPGSEPAVVENMRRHLEPAGVLIAGFQLMRGRLALDRYDALASAAGLRLAERWATWDHDPWQPGCDYAVSVHRLPSA